MFNTLDLFAGIGGFSLGLEATGGFKTVAFCEQAEYPAKILQQTWPGVPIYDDVRTLTADRLVSDGVGPIDCITGGFPCQDISTAGDQAGIGEGTRSGLWSECARLIGEIRPRYAIFENVSALLTGDRGNWFKRILWDISALGYDAEWHCIPASALGASHRRDRIWIITYPNSDNIRQQPRGRSGSHGESAPQPEHHGQQESMADPESLGGRPGLCKTDQVGNRDKPGNGSCAMADPGSVGLQGRAETGNDTGTRRPIITRRSVTGTPGESGGNRSWWPPQPGICRVAYGVPDRAHRLKALGNAICPPMAEMIGREILRQHLNETEI